MRPTIQTNHKPSRVAARFSSQGGVHVDSGEDNGPVDVFDAESANTPVPEFGAVSASPEAALRLEVDILPRATYAMAHNRVPTIGSIRVRNVGSTPGGPLTITVTSAWAADEVAPLRGEALVVECPLRGDWVEVSGSSFRLDDTALVHLEEAAPATVVVTVTDDVGRSASVVRDLTIMARNQWTRDVPIITAAFVQPNHPSVHVVLNAASEILKRDTGSSALQGYQAGAHRVMQIAQAVYEAMHVFVPNYINPPASFDSEGQKVRPLDQVLEEKQGTCLDLACAYASVLQQAGINTVVVLVHGHAFPAFFTEDEPPFDEGQFPEDFVTSISTLLNFTDSGRLVAVESTCIPAGAPFAEALNDAVRHFAERPASCQVCLEVKAEGLGAHEFPHLAAAVDIRRAYLRAGIRPIPARVRSGDIVTIVIDNGPSAPPITEKRDAKTNVVLPNTVPARVQQWKNSLLDLSLRNRLLNFNAPVAGIQLMPPKGRLGEIEDFLVEGGRLEVWGWEQIDLAHEAVGTRNILNADNEELVSVWEKGRALIGAVQVGTSIPTRAKNLMSKAKSEFEDTAVNNLNLALGSIEFKGGGSNGKDLIAPVFLLPVTLTWNRGRTAPVVTADPAGLTTPNYCLVEWLRAKLPLELEWFKGDMSDGSGLDILRGLDELRRELVATGLSDRITVNDDASLGILRFDKIRLWKDLDEFWVAFSRSPVVGHLVEGGAGAFVDPANPDGTGAPQFDDTTLLSPQPADGAQTQAIVRALAGHSFVLEGPPGTGKSQTITNLLANALASGKKVLFVAQKPAALDVVRERLEAVGLAPFCLDLHDKKSTTEKIKEQLRAALDFQPSASMERWEQLQSAFEVAARALDSYRSRLHDPTEAGRSYFDAYAELEALGDGPTAPIGRALAHVDRERLAPVSRLLLELPEYTNAAGPQPHHPWRFVGATDFAAIDRPALAEVISRLSAACATLTTSEGVWAVAIASCPDTAAFEGVTAALAMLERGSVLPAEGEWRLIAGADWRVEVEARLADVETCVAQFESAAPDLPLDVLLRDCGPQAAAVKEAAASFVMGRKGRVAAALGDLAGSVLFADKSRVVECIERVHALSHSYRANLTSLRSAPGMAGAASPESVVGRDETESLRIRVGQLSSVARSLTSGSPQGDALRVALQGLAMPPSGLALAVTDLASGLDSLLSLTSGSVDGLAAWTSGRGLLNATLGSLPVWSDASDGLSFVTLGRWTALLAHVEPLTAEPFGPFRLQILDGEISGDDAGKALERALMNATLLVVGEEHHFDVFDWTAHDRQVGRFVALLQERQDLLRSVIPSILYDARTFDASLMMGAVGQLRVELNSKRRGARSVRDLMGRYPDLITQLTPCLLMSPDSVAKFLEPGKVEFDLVVFDEASQITVPDAVGAMGRAASVVIVGDSRQMPPTSAFSASLAGSGEDEGLVTVFDVVPDDADSILEECVESGLPREWLSWHYRSRDELLIAFSNEHYYDGRLSSFPAAITSRPDCGLDYHRVQGQFDHGATKTNSVEADAIIADVVRRAHDPALSQLSMGIVALNLPQADLIKERLEQLQDPAITDLLETDDPERSLFVLNLESVQGRERDVIILGTSFSRRSNGDAMPLQFGPLTLARGERRLNVAVTRARRQMVVYSSFDPEELGRASSTGLVHLREYLFLARRAASDRTSLTLQGTEMPLDPHVIEVAEALRARGLVVKENVGLSSFKVDLAVTTPEHPDRWLVAVLLDGRQWGQRKLALDRDALPVTVLHNLMDWPAVARVWLPSWRRDRDEVLSHVHDLTVQAASGEFDREVEVVSAPVAVEAVSVRVEVPIPAEVMPRAGVAPQPTLALERPYVAWEMTVAVGTPADLERSGTLLQRYFAEAAEAEGPLTVDSALRKVARGFGLQKARENRLAGMRPFLPEWLVVRTEFGEWLYPPGFVRDGRVAEEFDWFRRTASADRKINDIDPREITNALVVLARQSYSISRAELVTEVLGVFGYARRSQDAQAYADRVVGWAVANGFLVDDEGMLRSGR